MKPSEPLSAAKSRLLHSLKTKGPQSASSLARRLRVTSMAVRQHLSALSAAGLVVHEDRRGQVGRPRRIWSLSDAPAVQARFPDSHSELTIGLLEAARRAFGAKGVEHLLDERTESQVAAYAARVPEDGELADRVAALTRIRREEGYLAEWKRQKDGGFLLVENHCPICAAAQNCAGICRTERELFERVLGPDVTVERVEHLLDGARRCAYRIDAVPGDSRARAGRRRR